MSASLIAAAFRAGADYAEQGMTGSNQAWIIKNWVRTYGSDRRFTLHLNAAASDYRSALVTYRGVRYYVWHDWASDTWHVERSPKN